MLMGADLEKKNNRQDLVIICLKQLMDLHWLSQDMACSFLYFSGKGFYT